MYTLHALIGAESALRRAVDEGCGPGVVSIGQGLWLLPLSPGAETGELKAQLADWSRSGPLVYCESEYFGGVGSQVAQGWADGELALGPVRIDEGEEPGRPGTPISQALRWLGAVKGDHVDEFAAVGLDRYRSTEEWAEQLPSS